MEQGVSGLMAKRRKRSSAIEAPTSACLLLCDDVLVSQGKNKHTLVGIVGGIGAAGFPAVIGGFVAYGRFSNVYSNQKIAIRFSKAIDEDAIFEIEATFPGESNPLGVYTIVIPIPPFPIREGGRYLFGAYHDGVPIATYPIEVHGPAVEEQQ